MKASFIAEVCDRDGDPIIDSILVNVEGKSNFWFEANSLQEIEELAENLKKVAQEIRQNYSKFSE